MWIHKNIPSRGLCHTAKVLGHASMCGHLKNLKKASMQKERKEDGAERAREGH